LAGTQINVRLKEHRSPDCRWEKRRTRDRHSLFCSGRHTEI